MIVGRDVESGAGPLQGVTTAARLVLPRVSWWWMSITGLVGVAAPFASLVLLLAGVLQLRAGSRTIGAVCLVLAAAVIIAAGRLSRRAALTPDELALVRLLGGRVLAWSLVVGLLSVAVANAASDVHTTTGNHMAIAAWLTSVILGAGLASRWHAGRHGVAAAGPSRREAVALGVIVLSAAVLRFADLAAHPYPWSGDEISVGREASRILRGEVSNLFETGWSSQPNWSFVPTAASEALFGPGILAIRLPSAVAGTLAVLCTYLAGRSLFTPAVGLVAAGVLAALPYHVHFSRLGFHNVQDSLMAPFVIWLVAGALRTRDTAWHYRAGAAAGLCVYTYAGTRLVLLLAFSFVAAAATADWWRGRRGAWQPNLSAFSVAALVSAAPQLAFFATHPDIAMGRMSQEGIFLNGWVAEQLAAGRRLWEILGEQTARTFLVFVASPAIGNLFNSPGPYLTVAASVLFLAGTAYAIAAMRARQHLIVLAWFSAALLLGGVLTMHPPAHTRLLMSLPPAAILVALGATKTLEHARHIGLIRPGFVAPALVVVVSAIGLENSIFYMHEYRSRSYFEDANSEYAMEVGLMARTLGPETQVMLLGAPRVFADFPTLQWLVPGGRPLDLPAEKVPDLELAPGRRASFFATPENGGLLQQIRLKYPGGRTGIVHRHTRPAEPLFEYYVVDPGVPAGSLARRPRDGIVGRHVTAGPVRQPPDPATP